MVKAGVGLIVSFRNKGFIRLHHFETLEHLQDINMASVARSFLEGSAVINSIIIILIKYSLIQLLPNNENNALNILAYNLQK